MARVSIYLNFMGDTRQAFEHYREVFGGEFTDLSFMRDVPAAPGQPPVPEAEADLVMHVALPILGGTMLMGTDMLESMGHRLERGNNVSINLEPDTLAEAQRLFQGLADGGSEVMPLQPMFWGAHFGTCVDRFGVRWMVNVADGDAADG